MLHPASTLHNLTGDRSRGIGKEVNTGRCYIFHRDHILQKWLTKIHVLEDFRIARRAFAHGRTYKPRRNDIDPNLAGGITGSHGFAHRDDRAFARRISYGSEMLCVWVDGKDTAHVQNDAALPAYAHVLPQHDPNSLSTDTILGRGIALESCLPALLGTLVNRPISIRTAADARHVEDSIKPAKVLDAIEHHRWS